MTSELVVLVTGATGKLGARTCHALAQQGFRVRGTDQKAVADFGFELELGDLKDEYFVHRLVRGVNAVVHLGNHPNQFAGPSAQRILAENTQMNANVFHSCVQLGVQRVVFASSVQAFLYTDFNRLGPPYRMPYLPLDGHAACAPGPNTYGQSKEFAERMLQLLCAAQPQLCATSLRFPMLVNDQMLQRIESIRSFSSGWFNFHECMSHLTFDDGADLISRCVQREAPGYRQYFPAQAMQLRGRTTPDLIATLYPDTELRRPAQEIAELIDISEITRETGWRPSRRILVPLDD
jgi:nucleoside-diphosphate-sugar epimerase